MRNRAKQRLLAALFYWLMRLLANLPLLWVHRIGSVVGHVFFRLRPDALQVLKHNLSNSGLISQEEWPIAWRANVSEMGKTMLESMAIWGSSSERILPWIRHIYGKEVLQAAHMAGKGIIFLTPHLGAFELASIYYSAEKPMTILFRPSRQLSLDRWIRHGRRKGKAMLAETNTRGVRLLLSALKKGEAIGILPDQIASKGDGEWAPFFGRPAYTMTLLAKLVRRTNAVVVMAAMVRLPNGQGFELYLEKLDQQVVMTTSGLNRALEETIRISPLQYMWSYDRYKRP